VSFLYAWAVGLTLSVAIPLILHLRRRNTDRRVAFPALRYLSRAEDARSRSFVASDVLLLATRIGLLLALAFAAAGLLLGRGGAGDHDPTDLALVIDNSASTGRLVGDRPLFEELLDRARQSLAAARPEDRVWVFPTVGPPVAAGVSAVRASEALARVTLSDGGADLVAAVVEASSALPADGARTREVQLVSDLQRTALRGPPRGDVDGTPLIAYLPQPHDEPNAAVSAVQLTGGTTVPSGVGHGVLVSTALGGGPVDDDANEASVRLQLDGRIAGAARIPWGATGTLGLPELPAGTHEGRVEVDPSGARADDIRFFSIQVVAPPGVRFVGPDTSFARIGVETLRQAGRLGASGETVTLVDGVPSRGIAGVGSAESRSTLVLIPPTDPVDLPAYNQVLAGLDIGWSLRPDPERGTLALEEPSTSFSLSGVTVRERYLLVPGAGAAAASDSALLRTEDGEPWLVRTSAGGTVALLLGSPLVPGASDLPTHPAIIPFLEALLVQWSHLAGWPASDFDAGVPIPLPSWASAVTGPDDRRVTVEGGAPFTGDRAGVYRVEGSDPRAGPRAAHFAVNVPADEIDPTLIGLDRLAELFPGRDVVTGGPGAGAWGDRVFGQRRGRDMAPWLLGLALALAAVELFLATPGRAKKRANGSGRWGRTAGDAEASTGTT